MPGSTYGIFLFSYPEILLCVASSSTRLPHSLPINLAPTIPSYICTQYHFTRKPPHLSHLSCFVSLMARSPRQHNNHGAIQRQRQHASSQFKWSTEWRSPHLVMFLSHVKDGITAAMSSHGLQPSPTDAAWLQDHQGHFMSFLPWTTREVQDAYSSYLRRQQLPRSEDSKAAFINHYMLSKHTIINRSPRIAASKADSYHSNCEKFLRKFWFFLAFVGD